jgi:hypothetical protein
MHTLLQDDREEISNRVTVCSGKHVKGSISPDFTVFAIGEVFAHREWLHRGISSVIFDPSNDKLCFGFVEEFPGFWRLFREVN